MPVCDLSVARSPQEIPQSFGPPPRMLNLPVRLVLLKYVGQGARIFVRKKNRENAVWAFFVWSVFGWLDFCCQRVPKKTTQMVYHFLAPIKIRKAIRFKQGGGTWFLRNRFLAKASKKSFTS